MLHAVFARSAFATRLFNLTITNVPGPQLPLYAFGARMEEVLPLVPLAAEHAVGVAVVSYDGQVFFGLNGDQRSMRDLDVLADGIEAAIAELRAPGSHRTRPPGPRLRDRRGRGRAPVGLAPARQVQPVRGLRLHDHGRPRFLGGVRPGGRARRRSTATSPRCFRPWLLVVAIIALVAAGYHGLIARFPNGGGGPEALAAAFGEGWAFLPLGALLVDFTLTIAVSCAAGASALIAYVPGLAGLRVPIALALVVAVGAATLLGHRARSRVRDRHDRLHRRNARGARDGSAAAGDSWPPAARRGRRAGSRCCSPCRSAWRSPPVWRLPPTRSLSSGSSMHAGGGGSGSSRSGSCSPSSARSRSVSPHSPFGSGSGEPAADSTLLADVAREATGGGAVFAAFQGASALLLLAAAASSYLAGSGLLEALAAHGGDGEGLIPRRFRLINSSYVPPWGIAGLAAVAAFLVLVASAREQALVHYYAAAVFASFLGALLAGTVLSYRDRRPLATLVAAAGTAAVGTRARAEPPPDRSGHLARASPPPSRVFLWHRWVARGRPGGVARIAT